MKHVFILLALAIIDKGKLVHDGDIPLTTLSIFQPLCLPRSINR
jgi:hypothetical protein